jgi:hypothetical protein
MPQVKVSDAEGACNLAKVLQDESDEIERQCNARLVDVNLRLDDKSSPVPDRFGLAFSGGGIRSACIGFGVVQRLARARMLRQVHVIASHLEQQLEPRVYWLAFQCQDAEDAFVSQTSGSLRLNSSKSAIPSANSRLVGPHRGLSRAKGRNLVAGTRVEIIVIPRYSATNLLPNMLIFVSIGRHGTSCWGA